MTQKWSEWFPSGAGHSISWPPQMPSASPPVFLCGGQGPWRGWPAGWVHRGWFSEYSVGLRVNETPRRADGSAC